MTGCRAHVPTGMSNALNITPHLNVPWQRPRITLDICTYKGKYVFSYMYLNGFIGSSADVLIKKFKGRYQLALTCYN